MPAKTETYKMTVDASRFSDGTKKFLDLGTWKDGVIINNVVFKKVKEFNAPYHSIWLSKLKQVGGNIAISNPIFAPTGNGTSAHFENSGGLVGAPSGWEAVKDGDAVQTFPITFDNTSYLTGVPDKSNYMIYSGIDESKITGSITALSVNARVRLDGTTGSATIVHGFAGNAGEVTTVLSTTANPSLVPTPAGVWFNLGTVFTKNPFTNQNWTISDLKFGVQQNVTYKARSGDLVLSITKMFILVAGVAYNISSFVKSSTGKLALKREATNQSETKNVTLSANGLEKDVMIETGVDNAVDDMALVVSSNPDFANINSIPSWSSIGFTPSVGELELTFIVHNPDDTTPAFTPAF